MALASHVEADEQILKDRPTDFKTDRNLYELRCRSCGDTKYVDEATLELVQTAVAAGWDTPFLCDDCVEESDDSAYPG